MSSYLMIPGAGGAGWYWHRVVPLLEAAGHEAIAVDLPGPDPEAGLPEYTELALAAAEGRTDYNDDRERQATLDYLHAARAVYIKKAQE